MQEKEHNEDFDQEIKHEKVKLKDGRYMIFYEFNDLTSGSLRKDPEVDGRPIADEEDV